MRAAPITRPAKGPLLYDGREGIPLRRCKTPAPLENDEDGERMGKDARKNGWPTASPLTTPTTAQGPSTRHPLSSALKRGMSGDHYTRGSAASDSVIQYWVATQGVRDACGDFAQLAEHRKAVRGPDPGESVQDLDTEPWLLQLAVTPGCEDEDSERRVLDQHNADRKRAYGGQR